MNIVIAGELPLTEELASLIVGRGHNVDIVLVEDVLTVDESGYTAETAGKADIVIELLNESSKAKRALLSAITPVIPDDAIVLTSAMANSATEAASWIKKPSRVIGFGLIPPLDRGDTVEVAFPLQADSIYSKRALNFLESIELAPVIVADGAGLVRARIICSLINEAVTALTDGVASEKDIDLAMKLGTRYRFGPLEWADIIGLDFVLGVMDGLFAEWGDGRYKAAPRLRRMVAAGRLGKKSGTGFYDYGSSAEVE